MRLSQATPTPPESKEVAGPQLRKQAQASDCTSGASRDGGGFSGEGSFLCELVKPPLPTTLILLYGLVSGLF